MFKRRKTWFLGVSLLVLVVVFLITRGPEAPTPNPPGTFSFAVMGDAPYYEWEALQFRLILKSLDANDLSWVIDVGDIFWRPCTDEMYKRTLDGFNTLRHPVIYIPGDNEWTDCCIVDHPLVRRTTERRLDNVTRMQVPGSPRVGWVRVVVTPGADDPFAFEEHVVPRWKYW